MKAERLNVSHLFRLWHTTIIVEIFWAYYVCPKTSFDHGFSYMQSHALTWKVSTVGVNAQAAGSNHNTVFCISEEVLFMLLCF